MKKNILSTIIFFVVASINASAQIITTIAGKPSLTYSGDGGPATAAGIMNPRGVAVDTKGNLYICSWLLSSNTYVIRKVNPAGIISRFAGTDTSGFSGDGGPATAAKLSGPEKIDVDKNGNVYIADRGNNRVRKVDTFGIITTFAGNGSTTPSGDGGPANAAGLGFCYGVCCDTAGNVYIGAGAKIRKVNAAGIITTFAGTGVTGFNGDGIPATAAQLYGQGQITMDKHGNLFFGDVGNERVRKINTSGIITTVAGNGTHGAIGSGTGDGGLATAAELNTPSGVFIDNCDNLYIADMMNNRVRVVNGSGIIKTFAGTGISGFSGDGGAATSATLRWPSGVYLDKTGSIYIADFSNFRVRHIHMDSCRNTVGIASPGFTQGEEVLHIWPNPSSGAFSLRLSVTVNESAEVVVTNVVGEVVKQFSSATNKDTEVILHAPPGVYFVSVSTASGKWVEKMLVE